MFGHFLTTTDDYTCLLHEATSTNFAVVHKAYTVQMHILSYCINLHSQGCSLLNIKVGSEAINLQVESTVWTYYVHIFSWPLLG